MLKKCIVELPEERRLPANTNIFDLEHKWLGEGRFFDLMEAILLSFEGSSLVIDLLEKTVNKKASDESKKAYFKRVQKELASVLRQRLNIADGEPVHYSSVKIPGTDRFIVFFVSQAANVSFDCVGEVLDGLYDIAEQLSKEKQVRILNCLMTLLMKIAVFESALSKKSLEAQYYNEDLLLAPQFSIQELDGTGKSGAASKKRSYVTALRPRLYYSDFDEIVVDVSTVNLELTGINSGKFTEVVELELDGVNSLIAYKTKKYAVIRQCDARGQSRKFYQAKTMFGECRLYVLTLLMDAIKSRLGMAGIKVVQRIFLPHFEFNDFVRMSDDSRRMMNKTYLVKAFQMKAEGAGSEQTLLNYLSDQLQAELISVETFRELSDDNSTHCNFIFLFCEGKDKKCIQYSNAAYEAELIKKNKQDGKKRKMPEFNNTFQALQRKQIDADKKQDSSFDIYTEVKMALLEANIAKRSGGHCFQGFCISAKLGKDIGNYQAVLKQAHATPPDLINPDSGKKVRDELLDKSGKLIKSKKLKIHKIITELSLKESIYSGRKLRLSTEEAFSDGNYSVSYIRHTRGQDNTVYFHGKIQFTIKQGAISITDKLMQEAIKDALVKNAPYLGFVEKLYNESFYLHQYETGETLTSYTSGRTPRVLGNAALDLVSMWQQCETDDEKKQVFTKSTDPDKCIVPYYIAKGRSVRDHLSDVHRKFHRVYLQEHGDGVLVFVANASSPNISISKQTLLKQVICWDKSGSPVDWKSSKLVNDYLNSHSYDILSANESAKTSIFTKLAKLLVMN